MNIKHIFGKTAKARIVTIAGFIIFAVYSATLIYPFFFMFINSLKTATEFFTGQNVFAFPKKAMFSNYWEALTKFTIRAGGGDAAREFSLVSMFGISIALTLGGTVLSVLVSAMTAYAVCKYKFFGRNVVYAVAIFTMIIPLVGTLPSLYRLMNSLKLMNTFLGMMLLYASGYGFAFLLLYGYFKSLSWSYAEAAFVDGANDYSVFFKIMLPLSMPALVAVAVIGGIGIWNDYSTPSIFLKGFPSLAVGVNTLTERQMYDNNYPLMFTTMLIAVLPIVIIFSVFQKTIMENTIAGGLKG